MMIKLHKEGKRIAAFTLLTGIGLILSLYALLPFYVYMFTSLLILTVIILVLRFFRIPDRTFEDDPNAVFSPADGTVVAIEEVLEDEYLHEKVTLVSVFMSIHNVHINWYPISGKIKYYKYHPGKYLLARHPKSSELNERSTVVIENSRGIILVRQIAGYVARRVITYTKERKSVSQNEEMGFIKFGSRLDIYLPSNAIPTIKLGEKTRGGITKIATFSK